MTTEFKDKYIAEYAMAFMPVGAEKWTEAQTYKGVNAYLYEKDVTGTELGAMGQLDVKQSFLMGFAGFDKSSYAYTFGNDVKIVTKDIGGLNQTAKENDRQQCSFFDPVRLYVSDQYSFYALHLWLTK